MYGFLNYNFCGDMYALDATPTDVERFINITLTNGIFDHVRLSNKILEMGDGQIPTSWDVNTVLDCNFENNISGGNINAIAALLTSIRIKRRILSTSYDDNPSLDWITLKEYPIDDIASFSFIWNDNYVRAGETYQYAFVPVMNEVEGDYVIAEGTANFDAVYLADADHIYKLNGNVFYGDTENVNLTAVVEPIGSKYPIIVSNAQTNYHRGDITSMVLPPEFYNEGRANTASIQKFKTQLEQFLHNGKAKIFKDWAGNYFLVMIDGSPITSMVYDGALEFINISFYWVEVGDPNDQLDLYNNGLVEVLP